MRRATAALTAIALVAFASNSLLARAALRPGLVDAASFTLVRLTAGALALALVAWKNRGADPADPNPAPRAGGWLAAGALFLYAIAFSLAYLRLDAGTGALILFAAVQATMIGGGLAGGHRPVTAEWLGLSISLVGLVVLVAPGLSAPDPAGASLMALAGAAWGVYSLQGRGAADPVAANATNFARSVPMAAAASLLLASGAHASTPGLLLAAASGAITSGLGYAVWYAALRGLTPLRAGIVQLAVPVLAATGGAVLLGEGVTLRLSGAGLLVLGGIALAMLGRGREAR